jgi:hypothetical protein
MPRPEEPPEPWRSFFAEVDSLLGENVRVHCCGGFVVTQLYGVARTTNDVDFLAAVPNVRNDLIQVAGKGSTLHRRHKVYLDSVTVATPPEDYEERLVPMFRARGVTLSYLRWRRMIWLFPNWSGTSIAIVAMCKLLPARGTLTRRF